MKLNISELTTTFPNFRVAAITATGLTIPPERPEELNRLISERQAAARAAWTGTDLSEIPGVATWRAAYRAFGIKKTSYRSSVERIVKNALGERPLPRINGFVDAYNAVSLAHVMPAGADDLDKVTGDLFFRYAREGDSFVDMAAIGEEDAEGAGPAEDPPKQGEVVFADEAHVLCRRWNWRQDARSLVSTETRRAILTIQANGPGDLDAAIADATDLIGRFCKATLHVTIADRMRPVVDLIYP